MTELSPEICLKIKEARRAAKLSQSVVALEVGCKQSALSMFEQGDGTKLNDEVIEKLAKKFGVVTIFTSNTSARQKIGRNSLCEVIFLNVIFFIATVLLQWLT